jgi:hypothetical protein
MRTIEAWLFLCVAGCTAATAPTDDDTPPEVDRAIAAGRVFDAATLPADLRSGDIVRTGAAAALVPPPGNSVYAHTLHTDGREDRLIVRVKLDGAIEVRGAEPIVAADTAAVAIEECHDDQYKLLGFTWGSTTVDYRFNPAGIPDWYPLTLEYATSQIITAAHNVAQERNNCGRPDRISASTNYLGHTSKHPNESAGDVCTSPDGTNVVGFGSFDDGTILASTCSWAFPGVPFEHAYESDIRISKDEVWLWQDDQMCQPLAAEEYYDLQGVVTHERGHTFGLDDLTSPTHSHLTMYHSSGPCRLRKRTLGLGDMLGLEALY